MENYKIQYKLGSGNFAKVYLAVHTTTGKEVAIKLVDKKEMKSAKVLKRFFAEVANMKKLSGHGSITSLYDSFETSKHYAIVMEYMSGGELFDYVQKQEGLNETNARMTFRQIVEGVQYCHKNGIAHRDLKLENILLDDNFKAKIADFGFSKAVSSSPLTASSVGSPLYSSPEIIQGRPYQGPECDVWSLGVILYTMLTASMPFDDSNMGQFLVKNENGDYPEPLGVSDAVQDLISRMLDPNPSVRATIDDILSHPWMAGLRKGSPISKFAAKRRNGVCYDNTDLIHNTLLELNSCTCSCHEAGNKDSVFMRHCNDCEDIQANNPEIMMRRQIRLSRNSSLSSGYGSEVGSPFVPLLSPDDAPINILGLENSSLVVRRSSLPRKSSAGTRISTHQRCSVPSILRECVSQEEDIVFV